ncbi:ADP-ribosylglycohydrolase family protein [bacterium]|nr:ADP-ribosylglycohydrolase family protein [bacterium]
MRDLAEQFRGCLLGLACGNAIGAPLDRLSMAEIDQRFGNVRQMQPGGWRDKPAGSMTGDAQMMLCVLESYCETGVFNAVDVAERFREWYRQGPRDLGETTREACENLVFGYNFERAGFEAWQSMPESMRMGSGSLVRAAPTGLRRYHDNVHLIGESRVISGITHYDERCKLACVALNLAIAHLLLVGTDGLLEEVLDFIEPRNTVLGYALRNIPDRTGEELQTDGDVLHTLQAGLWAVINCSTFEEGVLLLVNRGTASSQVGAVAGALLGARFGVGAIPPLWLQALNGREQIDRLSRRLYELASAEDEE